MKIRFILVVLALFLLITACGAPKAVVKEDTTSQVLNDNSRNTIKKTPLQTSFLGIKFGDSHSLVSRKLSSFRPRRDKDGAISVYDQSFGGYNWNLLKVFFVDNKLYSVNFQNPFSKEASAKERFDSICKMLRTKYGELEPTNSGNGYQYADSDHNLVIISVSQGLSKGGKEYWYCELSYFWGAGLIVEYVKTLDEI